MRRPSTDDRERGTAPPQFGLSRTPARRTRSRRIGGDTPTSSGARMAGALTVIAVAALIVMHAITLATERGAALRSLRATLPALTDLDQVLATHTDDVRQAASATSSEVPIPGLPARITIPRDAATAGSTALRTAVLDQLAREVYANGSSVFRAQDAKRANAPGFLTEQWRLQRALNLLTSQTHARYALVRLVALVAAVLLSLLLWFTVDSRRRAQALGSAVAAGGVLGMLVGALLWGVHWIVSSGDSGIAAAVEAHIVSDILRTVLATGAVAVVSGFVAVVVGAAVNRFIAPDDPEGRFVRPRPGSDLGRR